MLELQPLTLLGHYLVTILTLLRRLLLLVLTLTLMVPAGTPRDAEGASNRVIS